MPGRIQLGQERLELRLEIAAQRQARVEGALVDAVTGDAQAVKLGIGLTPEPADQRLGDRRDFDACDVGQHHRAVQKGRIGCAATRFRQGFEDGDRQRPPGRTQG